MGSNIVKTKRIEIVNGKPVPIPLELDDKPRDLRKENMHMHIYCDFMARMLVKYGPTIIEAEKMKTE